MPLKVYLIGAGPGDPELITVKGRRLLQQADSVLYDHLANSALLDLAPPHAERLYVGKKKSAHEFSQDEICSLLIDRARRGLSVVRLKGGDPFIFGRGGEEAEALAAAGIPFEVVPGVTTPLGIAAYTGVPLTHREHTSAVTFVTGHSAQAIDWAKVGHAETLVIFMGLTTFPEIARELIANGRSPDTPAMAVRWATRPDQQTIVGTLADTARHARGNEAAGHHHRRRSGPSAREAGLVRAIAALRQTHRRHPRPRAGRHARIASQRARRRRDRTAHHRNPPARRPRASRSRHRPISTPTTG